MATNCSQTLYARRNSGLLDLPRLQYWVTKMASSIKQNQDLFFFIEVKVCNNGLYEYEMLTVLCVTL